MKTEIQKFHLDTLSAHNAIMFESLIFHNNLKTDRKKFIFEDKNDCELEAMQGYLAMKEMGERKAKYFIEQEYYNDLPIRINEYEEIYFKDSTRAKSVVLRPTQITPFRVKAERMFESNHDFIDQIVPFNHTRPEMWTLHKIIAIMGLVGKTFVCECSSPEFGKTSIYHFIDAITKKSPVFQPRSVPGILIQINEDGNMTFDEIGGLSPEVKRCISGFCLRVGDNEPIYINGAVKALGMKQAYNVTDQSITFLYNLKENYKESEQFFDFLFDNNDGIDSRFLKVKLLGKLIEDFNKNFNVLQVAEANKMFYMSIAKHLLYLKKIKKENSYVRRYTGGSNLFMDVRKSRIFNELSWGIDLYSNSQKEYEDYISLLDSCIVDYKAMVGKEYKTKSIKEEAKEPVQKVLIEDIKDKCQFCQADADIPYKQHYVCKNCYESVNKQ